jgi:hypothetical protein
MGVAKLVPTALLASTALYMGSNSDISQKFKMGDKSEGVANTL